MTLTSRMIMGLAGAAIALVSFASPAMAGRGGYSDYLNALKQRESSGNYQAYNQFRFMGAYQMGEAALIDMGFLSRSGNAFDNHIATHQWTSNARAYGIDSVNDFLNNRAAQDYAIQRYNEVQWRYIRNLGLERYVGQTINGILMTESGMLAGAHLTGAGNLSKFLKSGGRTVPRDGNNVPITHYISKFNGYDTPFGSAGSGLGADDPLLGDGSGVGDNGGGGRTSGGGDLLSDSGNETSDGNSFFEWAGSDSWNTGSAGPNGYFESDAPCAAPIEEGITEAATEGFTQTQENIAKDILKPASVTVASCLDDILNSGLSIFVQFKPPSLKDLFDGIADRVCDKMNEVFKDATKDLTDSISFEEYGIKVGAKTRVRKGTDSIADIGIRVNDILTGDRKKYDWEGGTGNRGLSEETREDPLGALGNIFQYVVFNRTQPNPGGPDLSGFYASFWRTPNQARR